MKIIFLILLILITNCTLIGPDYTRPEISLPNTFHQEVNKENVVTDLNM